MGRKAETHSLHKLHSDTEPYNWEEPSVSSFALRKRVWATYQAVSSQGFHMKDESLTHPALRAEGACITESHRTTANKEAVKLAQKHFPYLFPLGAAQREHTKITLSQF